MDKYEAYIIDFDGTLYYKKPMQICMIVRILMYLIIHPYKFKDFLIIKDFRKLRRKRVYAEKTDFEEKQYKELASKYNLEVNYIKKIINRWMFIIPQRYIRLFKNKKVINFINDMYRNNKKIIIYSDYPVEEKIRTLDIKYNYLFSSSDDIIKCMKPNNKGLINILKLINVDKDDVLYIGDDDYLDGICAKNTDVDYVNVNKMNKR